ncbi:MAG: peptidoglycan binding domain-containing protein [Chloroflexi bacterium]|nr:peptidoglycan binding domain-containing protein [Chloroflexota bacterium]MCI0575133.1 peptidoglycan binding domain-containing protein [Chloroflexota bacterium]MCI0646282.1 peptidoglycan binding domain-containing protein [Chloroflexota bacterium]MCI0728627.1 peptidoglycan binding domain-containing protein [Chloroflexota bacterium]
MVAKHRYYEANDVASQPTIYYHPADIAEAPTELWLRPPAEPHRSRWPLLLAMVLFLLLTVAVAGGLGLAYWTSSDLILPGVRVMDVPLGGQTTAEAQATLQGHWQQQGILLDAGDSRWVTSPADLGLVLDAPATVQAAHQVGRSLSGLEEALRAGGRVEVQPRWRFDPAAAEAYLQSLAPQVAEEPVNAGVQIVNGQAEATPPVAGRALDVPATLAALRQNPAGVLAAGQLPLLTTPVQPAIVDASAVAEAANQLLATTLSIHALDPITGEQIDGLVTPEVWSSWLSLDILSQGNPPQFRWVVDESQLRAYLSAQAAGLGPARYLEMREAVAAVTEAINAGTYRATVRVYYHDRQHVVRAGDTLSSIGREYGIPYPWIQQANPNLGNGLYEGQVVTIPSPDALLPLPIVWNKRIVVSITEQRVWVYENGNLKWEWAASTGIDESPTAPGVFQIQSHVDNAYAGNWDLWMPHFMGVYRPAPEVEFMNGFHGFPTRNGSQLLWTNSLGHKVTYGCILLSSENASTLYEWAEEGVVVEILP